MRKEEAEKEEAEEETDTAVATEDSEILTEETKENFGNGSKII